MTEEEKKQILIKYGNLCTQIGDKIASIEVFKNEIELLKYQAIELLDKVKEAQSGN